MCGAVQRKFVGDMRGQIADEIGESWGDLEAEDGQHKRRLELRVLNAVLIVVLMASFVSSLVWGCSSDEGHRDQGFDLLKMCVTYGLGAMGGILAAKSQS